MSIVVPVGRKSEAYSAGFCVRTVGYASLTHPTTLRPGSLGVLRLAVAERPVFWKHLDEVDEDILGTQAGVCSQFRGDAPVTWWGDGYMVEYNLGRPVGPDFVGKIDVNLGGRTRFIDLVYKDWSNTYFPPFDRLEIPEDAE